MKFKVNYNKEIVNITIKDDTKIISPKDVLVKNQESIITKSLNNPINSKSLNDFIYNKDKILIIVNDGTRPTPTAKVLETIFPIIKKKQITIMIATGVHRIANENELIHILGNTYDNLKDKVISHEARKAEDLQYIGTSRNGTPLEINKEVLNNEALIVIGSVEPHYFAGYTGGRKAIMPGVASFKSIEANHKHALDYRAKALNLKDNPVHLDMVDVLSLLGDKPIYSIMSVMDRNHNIYEITSGNIIDSFDQAIKYANEVFTQEINEKYDIVISVATSPMDIDLYQSQKAIDNGKLALKDNGILILVSACLEGVGEKAFYDLLKSCSTPEEVLENISNNYKLGYHKAGKMAEVMTWANIYVVSELENKLWEDIFIQPFGSIQDAINCATKIKGKNATFCLLTDGCITVPLLTK
ncbi:MAG: nickel-dependent lactate racemase [Pleomorphochaeta sp.]